MRTFGFCLLIFLRRVSFLRVLFTNNAPLIRYGLARGFIKNNCQVRIMNLWQLDSQEQKRILEKEIEEFKPNFVFAEGHAVGLDQNILFNTLAKMEVDLFYWAIEDPVHDWISRPYARHSRVVFTTAIECVNKYESMGVKSATLLFGCNPDFHHQTNQYKKYKHDIIFVGSNYDIRYDKARKIILPFVENDYDIKIWGQWWQDKKRPVNITDKYYGGILEYEELAKVYSSAKIVLGVHCDDSSKTQSSMRTYEALGCGAFYLTQYTPAHSNLFANKKHLVWSVSREKTLELADYYLKNNQERKNIARMGQEEVYQNHTYQERAEKVLSIAEDLL